MKWTIERFSKISRISNFFVNLSICQIWSLSICIPGLLPLSQPCFHPPTTYLGYRNPHDPTQTLEPKFLTPFCQISTLKNFHLQNLKTRRAKIFFSPRPRRRPRNRHSSTPLTPPAARLLPRIAPPRPHLPLYPGKIDNFRTQCSTYSLMCKNAFLMLKSVFSHQISPKPLRNRLI